MLNNLTGLRFYAAFWVFLYHFFPCYTTLPKIGFLEIGFLGVDIFFVLSGFILTYVYYDKFFLQKIGIKGYYNFLVKRFAKIYPLHFIITLIFIPLFFAAKYIFGQTTLNVYPDTLIHNFLLIHAWSTTNHYSWNSFSWSISAEWFAYLFLFVPAAIVYRKSKLFLILICLITITLFIRNWIGSPNFSLSSFTMNGFLRIIPEFLLGVLAGLLRMKLNLNKFKASSVFVLTLLFLGALYQGFYFQQFCIIGFPFLILALSYSTYFDVFFGSKSMIYLGNISYALYLTQLLSIIIYEQLFKQVFGNVTWEYAFIFQFSMAFFLNFLFAAIAYKYFEEPVRIYLVKRMSKK